MRMRTIVMLAVAAALVPSLAEAQRRRRADVVEIRGQVPTPQVVTVRPREVPTYSRQVLVPNFYDHDFWQSILPGYELVPRRTLTGRVAGDTLGGALAPPGTSPNVTPSTTGVPPTPADTTRRTPGTTPAQSPR